MQLRDYQQRAVAAVYDYLRAHDDNPACVLPTAAGKSWVMAQIAKDAVELWNGRVLLLAHVQELLEQNAEKIRLLAPDLHVGIYSAGLGSRDTLASVIVAGVQSAYKRAHELGRFDLAIVDESHLLPPDGEGTYRTLLADLKNINPLLRVIGFTATPFRMSSGPICGPENILNAICYEVGVRELIAQGYLCPLVTIAGSQKADFEKLHVRGGEFIAGETEALMDDERLVESACREIIERTNDRHSVLIFASGVKHANHVARTLEHLGAGCRTIFGDTLDFDRAEIIRDFREGKLKFLVNVNVLTTGFDAPNIDCVAMLRPTLSPGLWTQACGRGFRIHPSKKDCLILDFGGNALRHGPVDAVKPDPRDCEGEGDGPAKECPACHAVIALGYSICPVCGHVFPPRKHAKHDAHASDAGVLSGQATVATYEVSEVLYAVHRKRGAPDDAPKTMRVEYRIGFNRWQSEWICFEHEGYARGKAEQWWRRRSSEPVPDTAEEAVALAENGALCQTRLITTRSVAGDEFDRIVGYDLTEKPGAKPEPEYCPAEDSIIPF